MKKIVMLLISLSLIVSLFGCGNSTSSEIKRLQEENEELQAQIDKQNKKIKELEASQNNPATTPTLTPKPTTNSSKPNQSNNNSIAIDCPKTITKNGYNIEIVDIYTKCLNTSSTIYNWDGIFLFISCKVTGEEYVHDNKHDYFALYFDMYDVDNHYVGKVQAINAKDLNNVSYGTILNGDCILAADNVTRVVFNVTE